MLHTKSQGYRPSGSGEEDFLRVFTIYGRGGHLGHVTKTIWTNFRSPILRSLHMKYKFNWPSSFRGEDVWKCWRTTDDGRRTDGRTDAGRRSHCYTISSPMSLRLRWAKNLSSAAVVICALRVKGQWVLNIVCCIFLKIKVKPGLTLQFTVYSVLEYTYTLSSQPQGRQEIVTIWQ